MNDSVCSRYIDYDDRGFAVQVVNQYAAVLQQEITDALRQQLNLRIPVELAEPNSLPRFELKAQRWIRE